MKGAAGLGDPLLAPGRGGRARRRRGPPRCPRSPSPSTRSSTATAPGRGGSSALGRPREWWAERARARAGAATLIEPVRSATPSRCKLSPRWAAEFRGFWDLPEDFAFDGRDPDPAAGLRAEPGKMTPEPRPRPSSSRHPRSPRSSRRPRPAGRSSARPSQTLLDERLSRREVKDIQSGYKDPDRFDKWIAVLQDRVAVGRPDRAADRGGAEHRPPGVATRSS